MFRRRGAGAAIAILTIPAFLVVGPVVASAFASASASAGTDAANAAARRRLVAALEADRAANPDIPGEVVAVRAPGLDVTVASGLADVAAGDTLGPDTPFRAASVTKTFVAAAVLRLVERHELRLDDPIAKLVSRRSARILRADGYRPDRLE